MAAELSNTYLAIVFGVQAMAVETLQNRSGKRV